MWRPEIFVEKKTEKENRTRLMELLVQCVAVESHIDCIVDNRYECHARMECTHESRMPEHRCTKTKYRRHEDASSKHK